MTDTIGPFDTVPWSQAQWFRFAQEWAPSGVLGSIASSTSTGGLPFSSGALSVSIGDGRASVRGSGFERSGGGASLPVPANTNASLSRRDRVVLRRDISAKTIAPTLLQGIPASTPTAPGIQQVETGQWDLPLFSFLVPPNSGTALSSVIDERGWLDPAGDVVAFASSAGRDAYFPSPTEAQRCYVQGLGDLVYTGSAWARPADTTIAEGRLTAAANTNIPAAQTGSDQITAAGSSSGGPVTVRWSISLVNAGSGLDRTANIHVYCDSTDIGSLTSVTIPVGSGGNGSPPQQRSGLITHTPSAGSHTWHLRADSSGVGAAVAAQFAELSVVERAR